MYFCAVNGIKTDIYSSIDRMPEVDESNFFHSRQLFMISASTPKMKPYMAVCTDESGKILSQLLAVVRYRTSFIPPFLFMHCRIMGEGEYSVSEYMREELFGEMLSAITGKLNKTCLYIEVSDMSYKMFAYRQFRLSGFFPVKWMSIHNSLHSKTPEERISDKLLKRIENAYNKGVTCNTVDTDDDLREFNRLLRRHHWFKPKRYIPDNSYFTKLQANKRCQLFVTKYHNRVIGCSACVYSDTDAYLWYSAFLRKTYIHLHPDAVTVWHAIKYAYDKGYQHINFLDVGLPFENNPFREFILRFGGKPVTTYRWFRCSIGWLNSFFHWIYRG